MEERRVNRMNKDGMPNTVFECVINYIDDVRDRDAISLVCKQWYNIDALTRRHVTIALCYAATPQQLWQRFKFLESLKLKGKPRAAMFNLIPEDWGGYATPWVDELATSFSSLKALHFRRMIVTDSNLELLAHSRGKVLHSLKLDNCSGFSTDGLLHITRFCRNLKTLFLEESIITDNDGRWLHELAVNNTVLQTLNFYLTDIHKYEYRDLELIAKNCQSLVSVKISDKELLDIVGFFRAATALEEFCGGSFSSNQPEQCALVPFPPRLCRLGLSFMSGNEMPIVFPFASRLTRLDLLYVLMDTEDHCALIPRCPNLEVLETRNVIGNIGLELLAWNCKKLRRLRIEHGADEEDLGDEEGFVSHVGLTALALGCPDLEYLAVYVSDITNACLECMGTHWKNLNDFRLVLLDNIEFIPDLPLDNGVRALLQGCNKLKRFALYLRQCALTDVGLGYIGRYSPNVRWMLLGYVGETDAGLLEFSEGCPNLQKLEMRACRFSESALAAAVTRLSSLRYLWVQGYRGSADGNGFTAMARPFWNIELILESRFLNAGDVVAHGQPVHMLAYYSLAGQRKDFTGSVVPFNPAPSH